MYGPKHGIFRLIVKTSDVGGETVIYSHTEASKDIWWSKEFSIGNKNNFKVFINWIDIETYIYF